MHHFFSANNIATKSLTNEQDGSIEEIMGIKHKTLPIEGVQFHPESILSEHGHQIFKNFLEIYA